MNLQHLDYGSYVSPDDPGEPTTGVRRISVTDREADLLAFLARGRTVVEIGTGLGTSTRAMTPYARHLWTVDIDPWVQHNVWPTLAKYVRKSSTRPNGWFDMVFIDGDHATESATADIDYALSVVKLGMIVVHDANMDSVRAALVGPWHTIDTHHGIAICYIGWD